MRPAPNPARAPAWDVLQYAAGAGAVTVGLLYLTGLGIKSRELDEAGLSVRDVLPLFPVDHILRTSLTVVWPALGVLLLIMASTGVARMFQLRANRAAIAMLEELCARQPSADLTAAIEKAESRQNWEAAAKEQLTLAETRETDASQRRRISHARRTLVQNDAITVLLIYGPGACTYLLLPPWIAIASFLLFLASLAAMLVAGLRDWPSERLVLSVFATFALGLVAYVALYPPPLAKIEVKPQNVSGSLVVLSDSTWYVAQSDGALIGLPADKVTSVKIDPQSREKPLWRYF